MTILASGDVIINGKPDTTRGMLGGLCLPDTATFSLKRERHPAYKTYLGAGPNSHQDFAFQRAPPTPHRTYPDKVHYRIVFKEVGKPVDKLTSLKDVHTVLTDILKGQVLRCHLRGLLILRIKFFEFSTNTC
jgi:hypothetical protein